MERECGNYGENAHSSSCSTVDNLRPIALTGVLSKIQESFVVNWMNEDILTWQNLGVTVLGYSKFVNIFGLIVLNAEVV
jgi:hypothetical protein